MLVETDAIVLHTIKYSETSVIAHIYTEQFGNGTYIMNGVRTNHSKMAMFQPLSFVHITAYRKKGSNQIHRISTISFISVPTSTISNIYKSTISLFIGEITDRIFKEEEQSEILFKFLKMFVLLLEHSEQNYANLHILYMLHITRFLGVFPKNTYSEHTTVFSPFQGQFVAHGSCDGTLSPEDSLLFNKILQTNEITDEIPLSQKERRKLLDILLSYYDIHICKTQNINSLEVLKMVFEN